MPKSSYISSNDAAFAAQLNTFKNNISGYSATLGLSAATVTAQAADADYFGYALACNNIMRVSAQEWSRWKELSRYGGTPPSTGMPDFSGSGEMADQYFDPGFVAQKSAFLG